MCCGEYEPWKNGFDIAYIISSVAATGAAVNVEK